ncbi:MAG: hypothetical protein ACI93H_001650, partial [Psychromonas sp.]
RYRFWQRYLDYSTIAFNLARNFISSSANIGSQSLFFWQATDITLCQFLHSALNIVHLY